METWGEIAERIYHVLHKQGYSHLVTAITDKYGVGATPGEMFSIVCFWLAKMRNLRNPAYELIKDDADSLLNYAVELKYFTKRELEKL